MIRRPPNPTLFPYTPLFESEPVVRPRGVRRARAEGARGARRPAREPPDPEPPRRRPLSAGDRKSTRLNSSHANISYAVFCLKKKKPPNPIHLHTEKTTPYSH